MRKAILVLPLLFLAACGQQQPQQQAAVEGQAENAAPAPEQLPPPPPPPPGPQEGYEVQNVRVVYRLEGPQRGTSTLWIEEGGLRVAARDAYTDFSGEVDQDVYWDGSAAHFRPEGGEVGHSPFIPNRFQPSTIATEDPAMIQRLGYVQTEMRTVAGKPCQVWHNASARIELCVWQGVNLQEFIEEGQAQFRRIATEVVEGERIPDEIRALAEGYTPPAAAAPAAH
jgi:hypothetical protein